jgi:hypothetical protein
MLVAGPGTASNPRIDFEFHFRDDNDVRLAVYRFRSYDIGGIVTSVPWQDNFEPVV